MLPTQDGVVADIASRVRAERMRRRWSLDELAKRSAVSRRLLVQIEHAEANPSLTTLLKLAAALGTTLTDLLAGDPKARPVGLVSEEDARTLWSTPAGSSARLRVGHGPLELWSWTLVAGDRRAGEPHRRGSLELLAVESGTVALEVGDDQVEISAGDSGWFDATWPHAYANPGPAVASFILVVLEPA